MIARTPRLPAYTLKDGSTFVATAKMVPQRAPWPTGISSDEQLRAFVSALWDKSYQAVRPEHDRMKRCQLYYDGFHYRTAIENFENEVTNYPFSIVETVWPEMVEQKPRPEIQPGYGVNPQQADDLQAFATWMMNTDGFDRAHRLGTREKLKLGWNLNLICWDTRTGMPYPKPWCNWDFIPDFTARHEDELLYFFLAAPVPTRLLQRTFPDKAKDIHPDNWVSPSFDVLVKPWRDLASVGTDTVPRYSGYAAQDRGFANPTSEPTPAGSTALTNPTGEYMPGAETTFLLQLFILDMTKMPVVYRGQKYMQGARPGDGAWSWDHITVGEDACESGWRVIQMTAAGTILDVSPLDTCYAGLPITMGRDYEQAFKMFSLGEIDHVIPKTRAINRRLALLNLALEYQCNPIAIIDSDALVGSPDKDAIFAGDVLKKRRASDIHWLEFGGPTEQQFALLQQERNDVDVISGVHDVQQGQRPPGIEAGVAIERLQAAASRRIRGKEPSAFAEYSLLVKKLMVGTALKAKRRIMFRATDGRDVTIDPDLVLGEYGITFVPGSGLKSSRDEKKSEATQLFSVGAIDVQELLRVYEWPGARDVAARMQAAQLQAMAAQAKAAGTGSGVPAGKKAA